MRAFRRELKALKQQTGVTYNRHHRIPKRDGHDSTDDEWNISLVKKKDHENWNALFRELSPHQIADVISRVWIDPRLKFICIPTDAEVVIIQKHK